VPGDTTAAVARIADLLKRNGFYNAGIEPATSIREPTQEVHIDYHVDPGRRAKFDGLVANGDSLRPLDKLIRSSGWKRFRGYFGGWHPLTESRLDDGLDNIRSWYPKHDRLLAQVTPRQSGLSRRRQYRHAHSFHRPGSSRASSPARRQTFIRKLRSLLPIYEERSVDRDLLEEGSRDLASYFETQGYLEPALIMRPRTRRMANN